MVMPFEIVSICVWLLYFVRNVSYCSLFTFTLKQHMLGLRVTDECLEQFFVFSTLLRLLIN